jgi:hypothetical protein
MSDALASDAASVQQQESGFLRFLLNVFCIFCLWDFVGGDLFACLIN